MFQMYILLHHFVVCKKIVFSELNFLATFEQHFDANTQHTNNILLTDVNEAFMENLFLKLIQKAEEQYKSRHGSLTRYVNLWVAHTPGMPGAFSPPPTSKETAI